MKSQLVLRYPKHRPDLRGTSTKRVRLSCGSLASSRSATGAKILRSNPSNAMLGEGFKNVPTSFESKRMSASSFR